MRRFFASLIQWVDSDYTVESPEAIRAQPDGVNLVRCIPFIILHLGCLGVIWVGWSWFAVWAAVFLYVVRMFAVTGIFHRYFSHKTYSTSRFGQFLLAHTSLETSAPINLTMVGIDGRPTQKSLRQMLAEWVSFRQTTVQRRTQHRLQKVLDRIHVLEGRQLVLLNIDEVIRIIRNADEPKPALIERFKLRERFETETLVETRQALADVGIDDGLRAVVGRGDGELERRGELEPRRARARQHDRADLRRRWRLHGDQRPHRPLGGDRRPRHGDRRHRGRDPAQARGAG